jgi:hypothetical protein
VNESPEQSARKVSELWAARSAALGPVVCPAAAVKPELEAGGCCSGGRSVEARRCQHRCRRVQESRTRVQSGGGGRLGQLVGSTGPQDSRVQPDRIAGVV